MELSNCTESKRAIACVMLPREHLPFIRYWCEYHIADGWTVFLYDNTGSTGSTRKTSVFSRTKLQTEGVDKRGNAYKTFTDHLTDQEVSEAMRRELEGLDVTIIEWKPLSSEGKIIHGQVEAYVQFIRDYGHDFTWAAFIDADEYLTRSEGNSWEEVFEMANQAECYRLLLSGIAYESRWTQAGAPKLLKNLRCYGTQAGGNKNIVRLDKVIRADIHWLWKMKGENLHAVLDVHQYFFRHYKIHAQPRFFTLKGNVSYNGIDESIEVISQEPIEGTAKA